MLCSSTRTPPALTHRATFVTIASMAGSSYGGSRNTNIERADGWSPLAERQHVRRNDLAVCVHSESGDVLPNDGEGGPILFDEGRVASRRG